MIAGRTESFSSAGQALIGSRVRPAQPIAVGHPQLAPLVRRLDVVVHGEAMDEVLLRLVVPPERRARERDGAVRRGLFISIAELETKLECRLRFVMRLLWAVQE